MLPRLFRILPVAVLLCSTGLANELILHQTAETHYQALNDLVHRVPPYSMRHERYLSILSAVQEQVILHERRMRGADLPSPHQEILSANYSAILNALIEDRIPEGYGHELLDVHRQLVDLTAKWASRRDPDEFYGKMLIEGMREMETELTNHSAPSATVPDELRTPVLNGHQIWMYELMEWGRNCSHLSLGDLGRLAVHAERLEQDERIAKLDGELTKRERERLHGRLIDLHRLVIDVLIK